MKNENSVHLISFSFSFPMFNNYILLVAFIILNTIFFLKKRKSIFRVHSSTLAWKIPWMEEPGGLQSMGSLSQARLSDFTFTFHFHALEKEMATHSSVLAWRIPGAGSLVG